MNACPAQILLSMGPLTTSNELIVYTIHHMEACSRDNIKKILANFYTHDMFMQAKEILKCCCEHWSSAFMDKLKIRKDSPLRSRLEQHAEDILDVLLFLDSKEMLPVPAFNIANLPQQTPEELNICSMLDRILALEKKCDGHSTKLLDMQVSTTAEITKLSDSLSTLETISSIREDELKNIASSAHSISNELKDHLASICVMGMSNKVVLRPENDNSSPATVEGGVLTHPLQSSLQEVAHRVESRIEPPGLSSSPTSPASSSPRLQREDNGVTDTSDSLSSPLPDTVTEDVMAREVRAEQNAWEERESQSRATRTPQVMSPTPSSSQRLMGDTGVPETADSNSASLPVPADGDVMGREVSAGGNVGEAHELLAAHTSATPDHYPSPSSSTSSDAASTEQVGRHGNEEGVGGFIPVLSTSARRKARKRQNNRNRVQKNSSYRSTGTRIGNGKGTISGVVPYTPVSHLFVYNLVNCNVESIKDHISKKGVNVVDIKVFSKPDTNLVSCKITVLKDDFDTVLAESFWPRGICFKPWENRSVSNHRS